MERPLTSGTLPSHLSPLAEGGEGGPELRPRTGSRTRDGSIFWWKSPTPYLSETTKYLEEISSVESEPPPDKTHKRIKGRDEKHG